MSLSEKLFYLGIAPPNWSLPDWLHRTRSEPLRQPAATGFSAQWHEAWPEDARLSSDMEWLLREQPTPTAFQSCAWQKTVAWPYIRARRYRLLTLYDGDQLAGLLPLWIRRTGVLEIAGSMISDYLEPLVSRRNARAAWVACLRALDSVPGESVGQLVLPNIRKECLDFDALAAAAAETGYRSTIEQTTVISRVPLPATWDEYLAGLDAHDRKEIRRKLRNAETRAGVSLAVAQSRDDVLPALERTFAFMRQGGWEKHLKVIFAYRPLFQRAAADLARAGLLEVYLLRLGGREVAGVISFPSRDGPLLWGAGFDPAARGWSPGIVLFAMAIKQAIAGGARYFDLMRGEARYKNNLGAADTPIYRVTLSRTRT